MVEQITGLGAERFSRLSSFGHRGGSARETGSLSVFRGGHECIALWLLHGALSAHARERAPDLLPPDAYLEDLEETRAACTAGCTAGRREQRRSWVRIDRGGAISPLGSARETTYTPFLASSCLFSASAVVTVAEPSSSLLQRARRTRTVLVKQLGICVFVVPWPKASYFIVYRLRPGPKKVTVGHMAGGRWWLSHEIYRLRPAAVSGLVLGTERTFRRTDLKDVSLAHEGCRVLPIKKKIERGLRL